MALADRPTARTPHGPRCGVAKCLGKLPPDDWTTLLAWLADEDVEATTIANNVTAEHPKLHLSQHMVRNHTSGRCSCGTR